MDGVWSQCGNNFLVLIDPWPHLSLLSSPWPSNQDICGSFKNKYLGAWVDSLLILRSNPTLSYFRSAQLVIYIYVPIYAFTIFCWTEQSTRCTSSWPHGQAWSSVGFQELSRHLCHPACCCGCDIYNQNLEQNQSKNTTGGWSSQCTVISVIMPPPHFYRKYAPPFSEGSFLKILWWEMPGWRSR